jgi:RNA polymerase sigma-70 factor (ECF subfamily)
MTTRRLEERFERFRRDGDARALAEVFDETAPELLRLARHFARRGEAEDLVQATFLLAIEKRASFDASRPLLPWLTGILVRQAASARRALAREVDPARLDERANPDPQALAEARELSEALGAALAELSAADREVLIPLLFDGRRAVEIARVLGRRPEAVHMRVHRGLARLRRLLPASLAVALSNVARPDGLARVRAAVLQHAQRELGLAAGAAVPLSVLGIALSLKKLGLAAAALVVVLVAVRFVSGFLAGAGEDAASPLAVAAPPEVQELRAGDAVSRATRSPDAPANARVPLAVAASQLEIEVVRADGEPAKGAPVALVRADGPVAEAELDEHGRAIFAPGSGAGDLIVRAKGAFPHRARVSLAEARVRVELPRGEELSGRLLERDGSPAAGVELLLTTTFGIPGLDEVLLREADMLNADWPELAARAVTGGDGSFCFLGLPEGWNGELEMLGNRNLVEGGAPTASNRRWFDASVTGLVLTSALRPRLTGRVVEAGSRRPLADHKLEARVGASDGGSCSYCELTDVSGRFELWLAGDRKVVSFQLVSVEDSSGRSSDEPVEVIRWEEARDVRDLGDLEVAFEPARPLEFAVRDGGGRPIPDARVVLEPGRVEECDSAGIARFAAVPWSATCAGAAASGYSVAWVEFGAASASPVEVVLGPTNALTVVLPDDVDPTSVRLAVSSRSPLFGGRDLLMYRRWGRGESGHCLGAREDSGGKPLRTTFSFAEDGGLVLEGLEERVPFRLEVESLSDRVVFGLDCEPMGAEERRLVRVELLSDPLAGVWTVRGRVIDERGRGVAGARVRGELRTGLDGRFSLRTRDDDGPSRLLVVKRGFAPGVLDLESKSACEVEVVLARGRDLELRVVDASGRVVEDAIVFTEIEGEQVVAQRDVGGRQFLHDLPAHPILVSTELSGRLYSILAESSERTATIEVPVHGRVEVAWSLPDGVSDCGRLKLFLRLPGAETPEQVVELSPARVEYVFRNVLPGEYELVLEHRSSVDEASREWLAVRGPVRIRVEPGETQHVELR